MGERGFFVTVEGIDGAGKSTQTRMLAARLRMLDREVVETREPGGSPGAEEIRRLLVEGESDRWSPDVEILLFTAARRDHVDRIVEPALARGAVVLCDRYVDSTRAYQSVDAPARRELIDRLHELTIGLDADLTLIFDMEPLVSLERAEKRETERDEDRFEKRGQEFQARLRDGFLTIAAAEPARCAIVDASQPPDAVAAQVWSIVASRMGMTP